ncbi:MAG: methionyl-tRNA formyltransferase [Actinomycetota bacterium]|jgi:methionyl-tRNA formyltransferase
MRLAFLGSPAPAVPFLRALVEAGHTVAIVVSQPDKRRGRGSEVTPSPVKAAALDLGLAVTDKVDDVLEANVELGVVVAFGRIIKPHLLEQVPMINVHFSLLPRWRGAAPVERAILEGDAETGVCIMALEEGLDTGPVYACERLDISADETAEQLRNRMVDHGVRLLLDTLERGLGTATPQEGDATYAAKLEHDDHHLAWDRPADELHRVVRVGRAWTSFRDRNFRVHRAVPVDSEAGPGELDGLVVGAGDGRGLLLQEVQPEGKARQAAEAWRNGARIEPGERFG